MAEKEPPREKKIKRSHRVAVPSIQEKRLKVDPDPSVGIMLYDGDNAYPQRILNAIDASGTGSACVGLYRDHLRGLGFVNKNLEAVIVNSNGDKFGDLHDLICKDYATFHGFAVWIGYNALLQAVAVRHIPFQNVRLGEEDDSGSISSVFIHNDWSSESNQYWKKSDVLEVDLWTDKKEKIEAQIAKAEGFTNWKGHVMYFSEAGKETYPKAKCDSVLEDVLTDAGVKRFKSNGVQTGWMSYYMMLYKGEFESDAAFDRFVSKINRFQGVDNSHRMMVVECPTEESIPELKKLEPVDVDRLFEFTEESCRENIIRAFEQPIALHWIKTPGQLGYSKEYEEAKLYYDQKTEKVRQKIGAELGLVFSNWYQGIPKDESGFKVLSLSGEISIGSSRTLIKELGAESMKDIKAILESTTMTPESKLAYIVSWYGLDENTVKTWIYGKTTAVPAN